MSSKQYSYMMSSDYCKNWTVTDAVREVLANALDTGTKVEIKWKDGTAVVQDAGSGMEAAGLLLGVSTKTKNEIGQFGEGLKIAALVFARQKRKFQVWSKQAMYEFTMKNSIEFGQDMLTVDIGQAVNGAGTKILFECTEAELQDAKSLFLKFNPQGKYDERILKAPGKLYVMGLLTQTNPKMMFGYNLTAKSLMNRDRSVLDGNDLYQRIGSALTYTSSKEVVTKYFYEAFNGREHYEHQTGFTPSQARRSMWRAALRDGWGDRVCISDGSGDGRAAYLGYKPVKVGWSVQAVLSSIGIKKASEVDPEKSSAHNVKQAELTPLELAVLNSVKKLMKEVEPNKGWWVQVTNGDKKADGRQDRNKLTVERKELHSLASAGRVLFHELAHWSSNGSDVSSSFEARLSDYLGRLAELQLK